MGEQMYALIVESREVRAESGRAMTEQGARFWVTRCEWVEATSTRMVGTDAVPRFVKLWDSADDAEAFAERWGGHPWWCVPNGTYEVVPVVPRTETVVTGWARAAQPGEE